MEYKVVGEKRKEYLNLVVNKMIKEGWKPLGGVSIANNNEISFYFIQAMIKEDKDE